MSRVLTAGLAAVVLMLSACRQPASPPPPPRAVPVDIRMMAFAPQAASARVGDTIVWHNSDIVPHTATAANGFDTGELKTGDDGRVVVTSAGTFDYICTYHPTMKGTITVTP